MQPIEQPFVIAECCNNFQGSMEIAKRMVEAASSAGVDAVKFQHRRRLTLGQLHELADHAALNSVEFMCTAYDREGVDEIDPMVEWHKIGSAEVVDLDFVRHVAGKGKPVIMSTGACTLEQVEAAVDAFESSASAPELTLMQCTSIYDPCPQFAAALGVMQTYHGWFGCPVGYSDHTGNPMVVAAAMALGAEVIEVHFTLSRELPGPDQECSYDYDELWQLCDFANNVFDMLSNEKVCLDEELEKVTPFREKRT